MSYLHENNSENLAARITYKGRQKIAQGNFVISYFQIGDSEFDYGFSTFDGVINSGQKVLMPLDKDSQVKYPYKVSESTLTGTTYGVPMQSSITETITNQVGDAGYVSSYLPFDIGSGAGTTVECYSESVLLSAINGTDELAVSDGSEFNDCNFITLYMTTLYGASHVIASDAMSLVYKIVSISGNTLNLDRNMPDLSALSGSATVIRNNCDFPYTDVCGETVLVTGQQDPWTLNTIWSQNPAGLDPVSSSIDEKLSGYTSNAYASSKEYFGYNSSTGQTTNTGTTIVNSLGDIITVPSEEQHSLALLHYSVASNISTNPWLTFKYEDYLDHTTDGVDYFEVYIPFIYYDRNTGTTIGARFFMDTTDYYINSSAIDTKTNQMKYRYLIDESSNKVGKVFVNHKVIVIDDQEIVAALDLKSNRRYTLPIPRITLVPTDAKCDVNGDILNPLLSGTTGETIFVTYLLEYTGDTALNGLHCNHYSKLIGGSVDGDVSIKFGDDAFRYMQDQFTNVISGYTADKFQILVQKVDTGEQPDPTLWKIIDFTDQIPNHTVGNIISPSNLQGARFIITYADYDNANTYTMTDPDLFDTVTSAEFGEEQPFTGCVKAMRATDIQVMRYLINLPSTDFMTTQNPSYVTGESKRITEVALLDSNKDVLVIAKAASPIIRTGTQVLSVKIDI